LRPGIVLHPPKNRSEKMNRFHVHLNVADLAGSIRFYTELFAAPPSVVKPDYAKWMLDDPRVNFAISRTGRPAGVDHLGLQVDTAEELAVLGSRLDAAGGAVVPEDATVCCYARSDKLWTEDPQGTRWETFHTLGDATTYHAAGAACATDGATCTPDVHAMKPMTGQGASCCAPRSGCC
jgi:catechol 2,3-dioxygenase-like lactoylglutathione lyase family enzyme